MTNIEAIERAAMSLVIDAEQLGLVLTIERRPALPLAMGNHVPVVTVRKSLATVKEEQAKLS